MATIEVSGGGTALQDAITSASDGDTIIVDDGVYSPIERTEDNISLTIVAKNKHMASIEATTNVPLVRFITDYANTPQKINFVVDGFIIDRHGDLDANEGWHIAVRGGTLKNCIIRNIHSSYSPVRGSRLINCLMHTCRSVTQCLCWGNDLYNCTITNCKTTARGWFLYGEAYNTIFTNIDGWELRGYGFASTSGSNNYFPEEVTNCTNSIIGTDALLDETYHLTKGSPCIGAGSAEYLQSATDLDGKAWETPPSIGCYEFYDLTRKYYLPSSLHPLGA